MLALTRPKVLLLAPAVVAVAAAAVLALRSWPSDTQDTASVLSKSREAEAKILEEATEGKVFHHATREFRRHGPGDPLIRKMSDEWYTPESYDHEFWAQVGPAGAITRWHGVLTDGEGNLIQEATEEGDTIVTRDVASGAEERLPLDVTVEDIARNVGEGVGDLEEKMDSGAVKIVGRGNVDGKKTIVVEWPPEPEPPVPELLRGATVAATRCPTPSTLRLSSG